jgi:hypothetical protein
MFDPSSRYFAIETVTMDLRGLDGELRKVAYKKRRFLPQVNPEAPVALHTVAEGQRLDIITARYAGDPRQFWRIADANVITRPQELETVGRKVRIPLG